LGQEKEIMCFFFVLKIQAVFVRQKLDILEALANLNEDLTAAEVQFREAHADGAAKHFAAAKSGNISQAALAKTFVK
jgi:hypothetical protein